MSTLRRNELLLPIELTWEMLIKKIAALLLRHHEAVCDPSRFSACNWTTVPIRLVVISLSKNRDKRTGDCRSRQDRYREFHYIGFCSFSYSYNEYSQLLQESLARHKGRRTSVSMFLFSLDSTAIKPNKFAKGWKCNPELVENRLRGDPEFIWESIKHRALSILKPAIELQFKCINVKVLQGPRSPCDAAIYPCILLPRWESGGKRKSLWNWPRH